MDLLGLPLRSFLNYIYKWLVDRTAPDKREELDYMLERDLPRSGPRTQQMGDNSRAVQDDTAAFLAAAGLPGGG